MARGCHCRKGSWHKIVRRKVRGKKRKSSVFMCQSKRTHKFTKKVCR